MFIFKIVTLYNVRPVGDWFVDFALDHQNEPECHPCRHPPVSTTTCCLPFEGSGFLWTQPSLLLEGRGPWSAKPVPPGRRFAEGKRPVTTGAPTPESPPKTPVPVVSHRSGRGFLRDEDCRTGWGPVPSPSTHPVRDPSGGRGLVGDGRQHRSCGSSLTCVGWFSEEQVLVSNGMFGDRGVLGPLQNFVCGDCV